MVRTQREQRERSQATQRALRKEMGQKAPTFGEWLQEVVVPGPHAISGMGISVDSEGGFLIPEEFRTVLTEKIYNTGAILRRVSRYTPTESGRVVYPFVHETSRADGSRFGGCRAYWKEEGGTLPASYPRFGQLREELKKVTCLVYATDSLVEDMPQQLAEGLEAICVRELTFAVEEAIVNGLGTGHPLGLLNAGCKIRITKETNQTAATVWGPNIIKMLARLWGPSQRTAVWLYNQELLPELSKLVVEGYSGSASSQDVQSSLWNWDGSPSSGGWPTLAGRPAIPTEYCQAPGTEGDLILVDLSQYVTSDKLRTASSIHVRFINSESAFKFVWRIDGRPLWSGVLTPYKGTDTLSPIVTLEDRS